MRNKEELQNYIIQNCLSTNILEIKHSIYENQEGIFIDFDGKLNFNTLMIKENVFLKGDKVEIIYPVKNTKKTDFFLVVQEMDLYNVNATIKNNHSIKNRNITAYDSKIKFDYKMVVDFNSINLINSTIMFINKTTQNNNFLEAKTINITNKNNPYYNDRMDNLTINSNDFTLRGFSVQSLKVSSKNMQLYRVQGGKIEINSDFSHIQECDFNSAFVNSTFLTLANDKTNILELNQVLELNLKDIQNVRKFAIDNDTKISYFNTDINAIKFYNKQGQIINPEIITNEVDTKLSTKKMILEQEKTIQSINQSFQHKTLGLPKWKN